MSDKSLPPDEILTMLQSAPPRLAALTAGLGPTQLRTPPAPNEWSANDVLAHLRACADMWGGAILTILAGDKPTVRAINPRTWIKQTNYLDLKFQPSLRAYTVQRNELVRVLEALKPQGWSRTATVTGAGKRLERSVLFYAEWLALHERPHLKQIGRIADTLHK